MGIASGPKKARPPSLYTHGSWELCRSHTGRNAGPRVASANNHPCARGPLLYALDGRCVYLASIMQLFLGVCVMLIGGSASHEFQTRTTSLKVVHDAPLDQLPTTMRAPEATSNLYRIRQNLRGGVNRRSV